jgi:hypothetical protein
MRYLASGSVIERRYPAKKADAIHVTEVEVGDESGYVRATNLQIAKGNLTFRTRIQRAFTMP